MPVACESSAYPRRPGPSARGPRPALGRALLAGAVALSSALPALADPPPPAPPQAPQPVPAPASSAAPVPASPAARPAAPARSLSVAAREDGEHERPVAQAVALHDEARALYEHGQYREAIAKLHEALLVDPEARELVYNLALIHERLGDMDAAEAYYRRYLDVEPNAKVRDRVLSILKRLEGAKRELPQAAPADPAAALEPPRLGPDPTAAPRPARHLDGKVLTAGAVAAGLFLTSGLLAVGALAKSPGSHPTTSGGVSVDALEGAAAGAHSQAVAADVLLIAGAAAAGLAVWLYLGDEPKAAAGPGARARFEVSLGPSATRLRVLF